MKDSIVGFWYNLILGLFGALNFEQIVDHLVFPVRIDVGIEYG